MTLEPTGSTGCAVLGYRAFGTDLANGHGGEMERTFGEVTA